MTFIILQEFMLTRKLNKLLFVIFELLNLGLHSLGRLNQNFFVVFNLVKV
jgi:hypothetical protein